jgi:ABC-type hemin transport system substrate-binding protein
MPLVDALGCEHQPFDGRPRIVSLVPSLTELICDLGLADRLVGRTGFCVHPKEALRAVPKVGGTKDVKLDVVRKLTPTHLIADIDENRREAVEAMAHFVPHVVVVHPQTVDDNLGLYALLGGIFRREAEATRLATEFSAARDELAAVTAALPREAVLYPIWRDPWRPSGATPTSPPCSRRPAGTRCQHTPRCAFRCLNGMNLGGRMSSACCCPPNPMPSPIAT